MQRLWYSVFTIILMAALANAETKEGKIKRALSAAPPDVAKAAKVMDVDDQGKMVVLREGNNGFTCFPGTPGRVGDVAMCADEASMQWNSDLAAHKPKPTNTQPGVIYMIVGGTDWIATDPYATTGTPIKEPPHWMIMWPFDPKTTHLPTEPKQTGTWIMWAGTPWAHLMINQRPRTFLDNGVMPNTRGLAVGASDEENTGPKLQLSLAVQFAGTVSGSDQFQSTLTQFEIQEV